MNQRGRGRPRVKLARKTIGTNLPTDLIERLHDHLEGRCPRIQVNEAFRVALIEWLDREEKREAAQ